MLSEWLTDAGLDLFQSTQAVDSSSPNQSCVCCCQLESGNFVIWLISPNQTYRTVLSETDLKNVVRKFKVTPVEFLTALRDSFSSDSVKFTKEGNNVDLSFSNAFSGKLNVNLESVEPDGSSMRQLLLQFGRKQTLMKQEISDLKTSAAQTEVRAKPGFQLDINMDRRLHTQKHKKPKVAPGMSVINPRSRAIKAPKGVVFEESDEE